MKIVKYILSILIGISILSSCTKDYFDTKITSYLDSNTAARIAASDPKALDAYLLGSFSFLVKFSVYGTGGHDDFAHMSVMHSTDLMGQDIALSAAHWFNGDYKHDNHEFNYRRTGVNWLTYYTTIAKANEIISFFPQVPELPESKGVLAHGYALRGFAYYYLIQLYQHTTDASGKLILNKPGIPMIYNPVDGLTEDEMKTRKGRNTVKMVLDQIESDLTKAVELFEAGYTRPSKNYIDKYVANGLLARYYLLTQQWAKAAAAAKKAYAGSTLVTNQNADFNNIEDKEWMWGYDHNTESQTTYASFFSHISNRTNGYAGLGYSARLIDKALYDAIPDTDIRKAWFNGPAGNPAQARTGAKLPYANLKFGWIDGWVMDYMYMRAPEMYLIEAEALVRQGKNAEAATAMTPLMKVRQPGWALASVTLDDVLLQRRIELWGEGFCMFDLKRLGKGIDRNYAGSNHLAGFKIAVAPMAKTWIYQIPRQEMQENKELKDTDQNE